MKNSSPSETIRLIPPGIRPLHADASLLAKHLMQQQDKQAFALLVRTEDNQGCTIVAAMSTKAALSFAEAMLETLPREVRIALICRVLQDS